MIKVMCFGTFDLLHLGHIHYLEQAKKYGDHLTVVVARDSTKQKQGKNTLFSEQERMKIVASLKVVDMVVLGKKDNFFRIIAQERPDILCLGYDQSMSEELLRNKVIELGLGCQVYRITPFMHKTHKSSVLKHKAAAKTHKVLK